MSFFNLILLASVGYVIASDCGQKCICQEDMIFCTGIRFSPIFVQSRCAYVRYITIASSLITDLGFSKCFIQLEELILTSDTFINCTYAQKFVYSGINFKIEIRSCPDIVYPVSQISTTTKPTTTIHENTGKGTETSYSFISTLVNNNSDTFTTEIKQVSSTEHTEWESKFTTIPEYLTECTTSLINKSHLKKKGMNRGMRYD